ncbi:DUF1149 family protein [Lactovum odontotermitis]
MDILREKEFVSFYHYDARNMEFEHEHGTPETSINVQMQILNADKEANCTFIQLNLSALIVLERIVLSSALSQVSQVNGRLIESQGDLTQEDMQELASPLFELLKRLTYELTEVALDEPGLKLEF